MTVKAKITVVITMVLLGATLFLIGLAIAFYNGSTDIQNYKGFTGLAILGGTLLMGVGAWWWLSKGSATRH